MDFNLTGIILAGGISSRMGTDKALIEINGKSMIENACILLKDFCDEIILSTSVSVIYSLVNVTSIPDEKPGLGPIGGIYTCLQHSNTDKNLIIAVDIPFINRGIIKYLIENMDDTDIILPMNECLKPEPLCAIYSKSVLPALEKMIKDNDLAVHNLINHVKVKTIQINKEKEFYDEKLFYNLNTPADLNKIAK